MRKNTLAREDAADIIALQVARIRVSLSGTHLPADGDADALATTARAAWERFHEALTRAPFEDNEVETLLHQAAAFALVLSEVGVLLNAARLDDGLREGMSGGVIQGEKLAEMWNATHILMDTMSHLAGGEPFYHHRPIGAEV